LHHAYANYPDPPPVPQDGMDVSIFILLLIIALIVAIAWVIDYEPEIRKKKDDKTLREEIDGIFKDLRENAIIYDRPEFVLCLDRARDKVADALDKRHLYRHIRRY
jgi:hypothetical protein